MATTARDSEGRRWNVHKSFYEPEDGSPKARVAGFVGVIKYLCHHVPWAARIGDSLFALKREEDDSVFRDIH